MNEPLCFASPCGCCVCQGQHCLVHHPGHSHLTVVLTGYELVRLFTLAQTDADVTRLVKEHIACAL